uniref:Chemokine interleukin-8-like domain-containing protein n=1 Tax=Cyclopterus lumpus TaxID=8103 RepID=A0A8C2ZYC5_CYCLU
FVYRFKLYFLPSSHTCLQCLCQRVRNGIWSTNEIKDVQIYPATIFCDKVEIVGVRYCLNPELRAVQKLMASIMKRETSTTARPAEIPSTPY